MPSSIRRWTAGWKLLEITPEFAKRYLNEGFSGGEKKRNEILQMGMLRPEMSIMDETDSGLDIDALKIVSGGVNALRGPEFGALVITHYQRLLDYIVPDYVHVLVDGRIVKTGDKTLAPGIGSARLRLGARRSGRLNSLRPRFRTVVLTNCIHRQRRLRPNRSEAAQAASRFFSRTSHPSALHESLPCSRGCVLILLPE